MSINGILHSLATDFKSSFLFSWVFPDILESGCGVYSPSSIICDDGIDFFKDSTNVLTLLR